MKRVVVVGGGIAGLSTALFLKDRAGGVTGGLEVVLLESGDRVGGNIRTDREDEWTIERGPNGYLDNVSTTPALVKRLDLEDRTRKADAQAAKRFLYRRGRLNLLPSGPGSFLTSPILSVPGRLRVLGEPFARRRPDDVDETVGAFASRRIGREAAAVLVDAMVSGVFAGDIAELSLASTFPKMAEMENRYGSLVRAMMAKRGERRAGARRVAQPAGEQVDRVTPPGGPAGPSGTLTSFDTGLALLPETIARELGAAIRTQCRVASIVPPTAGNGRGRWQVGVEGDQLQADAVVLATPAARTSDWIAPWNPGLADTLRHMPAAPLAVVALGYRADEMGSAPRGFGFLAPRGEGPRVLGCLWDSSLFPGRAPAGHVLMRVMIGGAHDAGAVSLTDDELLGIVRDDLRVTMQLTASPVLTRVYRHHSGIAQYTVGHQARLDRIETALRETPGLCVAGSSYYGVSMNGCIQKASEQTDAILRFLGTV